MVICGLDMTMARQSLTRNQRSRIMALESAVELEGNRVSHFGRILEKYLRLVNTSGLSTNRYAVETLYGTHSSAMETDALMRCLSLSNQMQGISGDGMLGILIYLLPKRNIHG